MVLMIQTSRAHNPNQSHERFDGALGRAMSARLPRPGLLSSANLHAATDEIDDRRFTLFDFATSGAQHNYTRQVLWAEAESSCLSRVINTSEERNI